MSLKSIIDAGLQRLTNRNKEVDEMTTTKAETKNISRRRNVAANAVKAVMGADGVLRCGACGADVVQLKTNGRKACINSNCGREAI